MKQIDQEKKTFCLRMTAAHTIAYFIAGVWAVNVMNYEPLFIGEAGNLRAFDSAWIPAGAGLQVIRGAILGLILLPFRQIFIERERGLKALEASAWKTIWQKVYLGH